MRFILRTLKRQAELEGQQPLSEDPNNYVVVIDDPVVGRIYPNPIHTTKWNWILQSPAAANGYADSLDQAKQELRQRWYVETKKLSRH